MPAVPGAKRNQEKQKKKRDAAQRARHEANARAKARAQEQQQAPLEEPVDANAAPSPFEAGARPQDFDDLDELVAAMDGLFAKKQIDEAARKCAEIVRRFPDEPDGWQGFARVYEARGDLPRAISEQERAAQRASAEDAGTVAKIQKDLARLRATLAKRG